MSIYDIEVTTIAGQPQSMSAYRGKNLLIVNVASKCGFTPQYAGLQSLYDQYKARDFTILGFPCDQFGHQEPGNEAEIQQFCSSTYNVTFPMFAKISVNGSGAHPLYKYLKGEKPGVLGTEAIKWNFTKFLIDSSGQPVARYGSSTKPETLEAPIQKLL